MIFNDYCSILAVVTMILAWIPAYAGMTKLRDFLAKKSNYAEVLA
jgi:hypothetical protein